MSGSEERYAPPPDYELNNKPSLLDDICIDSNKELWLLQWPISQTPDLNGLTVTHTLNKDGVLGSFTASGKEYELFSFAAQRPCPTVFQSSATGTKIVGKISRRVSLIHYPDPSELAKSNSSHRDASRLYGSVTQGSRQRSASGLSQFTLTPSRISKQTSTLFETGEPSNIFKKKHASKPTKTINQFTGDSTGRDHSGVTSLGSAGHSQERKSKKNKHEEQ